jgi:hypothetical protein
MNMPDAMRFDYKMCVFCGVSSAIWGHLSGWGGTQRDIDVHLSRTADGFVARICYRYMSDQRPGHDSWRSA